MLKVALTGGIATGKSYVLDRFRRLGVPCLDADDLAHGVEATGTEATTAIAARFGADVLAADGSVNRAKLGPIVFADPSARRELEAIVHPAVYRAIAAGIRAFELTGRHTFAIVDVPLLFETGAQRRFDRVIVTACSADLQLARLKARGLTEDAARQRLAAQWPTEKRIAGADFVIHTDGAFDDTDRQVRDVNKALGGPV
ncbi:MAG TPA: dephospho-CoA kinase [Vicinamibacterales bacterium]|nr:dephospho-CoA kinase [Vicinamibacterales bacterium]